MAEGLNPTTLTHEEEIQAFSKALSWAEEEAIRLRIFIRKVSEAPDAMVCRLMRDAARQVLDGKERTP